MAIEFRVNFPVSAAQFTDLLTHSTLAERRPVTDAVCMQGMVDNSNLFISAWDGDKLVGVARSITDFHYVCYLSDLAVDRQYQKQGIGLQMQKLTQQQLGPRCKLVLVAAPAANDYYLKIGYTSNKRCWVLERDEVLKGA